MKRDRSTSFEGIPQSMRLICPIAPQRGQEAVNNRMFLLFPVNNRLPFRSI